MIRIDGLRSIRRDLKRLDSDRFPKAMVEAGLAVSEPLATRIRAALPKRTGDLARTVRTAKIRTGAAARIGYASVPYAGPVEFGGWPPGRPYLAQGRYIFPTAAEAAPDAVRRYQSEIEKLINQFHWSPPD